MTLLYMYVLDFLNCSQFEILKKSLLKSSLMSLNMKFFETMPKISIELLFSYYNKIINKKENLTFFCRSHNLL